jgi:hypothetical protein
LFPPDEQELVRAVLLDFGSELYGSWSSEPALERVWFAILKLSEGKLDGLDRVIARDPRDILVEAGFGSDIEAHNKWLPDKTW